MIWHTLHFTLPGRFKAIATVIHPTSGVWLISRLCYRATLTYIVACIDFSSTVQQQDRYRHVASLRGMYESCRVVLKRKTLHWLVFQFNRYSGIDSVTLTERSNASIKSSLVVCEFNRRQQDSDVFYEKKSYKILVIDENTVSEMILYFSNIPAKCCRN